MALAKVCSILLKVAKASAVQSRGREECGAVEGELVKGMDVLGTMRNEPQRKQPLGLG